MNRIETNYLSVTSCHSSIVHSKHHNMSEVATTSTSPPKMISTASISPSTRALMAGAVAGIVSDSMLHPVDTINLRMKVQSKPRKEYSSILRSAMTIMRNGTFICLFSLLKID